MLNVSGNKFRSTKRAWSLSVTLTLVIVFFLGTVGCSQSVDSVSITPPRSTSAFIFSNPNNELQGTSLVMPSSASRQLGIHTAGGNSLRTNATSASFNMTSGIGVD